MIFRPLGSILMVALVLLVVWLLRISAAAATATEDEAYTLDAFAGFQPAGVGTPDVNWVLHLTDVPYFFGDAETPAVFAGYDSYLYPDGTALLVEYRQSKGKVFERVTEWTVTDRELEQLQKLTEQLIELTGSRVASKRHQQNLAQQALPSKWDRDHVLTFSTLFRIKAKGDQTQQVELFDLPDRTSPLPAGFWEAVDLLKPLPPLFLYGESKP
jgi:hypothetical protein